MIKTFMDCPDRWWDPEISIVKRIDMYSCQRWYLDMGCVYICEECCNEGKCPRGFQR